MATYFTPQIHTRAELVLFGRWAQSKGFWVWEHSQFYKFGHGPRGTYRVNPVHARKSFHSGDLALDINWPNAGAERWHIINTIIPMCQKLGLSYIYAQHGTYGSARNHTGHIHVDVGTSSNNGARYFQTPRKNVNFSAMLGFNQKKRKPNTVLASRRHSNPAFTQTLQAIFRQYDKRIKIDGKFGEVTENRAILWQRQLKVKADGVVGPATVRNYLSRAGTMGVGSSGNAVRIVQYIVGVTRDGKFGPKTAEALKECQRWAGIEADGKFGPQSRNNLLIS